MVGVGEKWTSSEEIASMGEDEVQADVSWARFVETWDDEIVRTESGVCIDRWLTQPGDPRAELRERCLSGAASV